MFVEGHLKVIWCSFRDRISRKNGEWKKERYTAPSVLLAGDCDLFLGPLELARAKTGNWPMGDKVKIIPGGLPGFILTPAGGSQYLGKLSRCLPNTSTFVPYDRSQCLYWILPIIRCAYCAHLDVGLVERPTPCRFIGTVHVSFPRFREDDRHCKDGIAACAWHNTSTCATRLSQR